MAKQKKKSAKRKKAKIKIDWKTLLISAITDFIVGFLLLLIDKIIN